MECSYTLISLNQSLTAHKSPPLPPQTPNHRGVLRIEPPIHENQRQRGSGKKNKKQANEEEEAAWEATDVRIARIQLEQDSGKSQHEATKDGGGRTLVDLNRAGTALMEIVFEPDLSSPSQAAELVRSLQATLRHLGTCDGNMDEGSIRCDLNVSVRPASTDKWGPRAEIKNLNSLKSLQTAAAYEIRRQIAVLESPDTDEKLMGETRSFNALTGKTARMRAKEGAVDYRFFPEPDLPPLVLSEQEIGALRDTLPELPQATKARLVETYGLTSYQASVLMGEVGAVAFFEEVVRGGGGGGEGKGREGKNVANWVCNDLFGRLKASAAAMPEGGLLQACAVTSAALGELIDLVTVGNISMRTAKEVLGLMVEGKEGKEKDQRPSAIVAAKGWEQVSDEGKLSALAQTLIADPASARQLRQYKEGKLQMLQYFVGQAMKATEGRANPELMERLLKEALK